MVRNRALLWFSSRPLVKLWALPTTLSLDAPAVALLWQALFARAFGVRLEPYHYVLLGTSVWLVYAADRLLDGLKFDGRAPHTARHRFYATHRRALFVVWLGLLVGSLGLALSLTRAELGWGLGVAGAALLYLLGVHVRVPLPLYVPKEAQVGALFGVGAALFLLPRVGLGALLLPMLFFGLLCALNCAFIALWEAPLDRAQGQPSVALCYPRIGLWLSPLALGLAGLALAGAFFGPHTLLLCVAASALLLCGLEHLRRAFSLEPTLLRTLADAALLTPLPLLLLWPWLL